MSARSSNHPPISLVIPVRNEALTFGDLLASVMAQTHRPDEIIFVDSGSDDGTATLIRDALKDEPAIKLIEATLSDPGHGRNLGIASATNEWVALTDAGIRLEPTWLEELVKVTMTQPDVDVVYGNYEPIIETFFERNASLVYVPPKRQRPGGEMRGPCVPSCLLRRSVWQKVGGFPHLRAAEDLIFIERIEQGGFRIGWAPRATVWWQLRPTLGATFRRFVLYSRHNVLAGRQRYWHYGVARQYVIALIFALIAVATGVWWWLIPIPVGLLLRALKSFWNHRKSQSLLGILNPVRVGHVLLIILAIDLATFIGWAQAAGKGDPTIVVDRFPDKRV